MSIRDALRERAIDKNQTLEIEIKHLRQEVVLLRSTVEKIKAEKWEMEQELKRYKLIPGSLDKSFTSAWDGI